MFADEMRGQTVADIDGLANRIILKVALALAALLVLTTLSAVLVRRTAAPRPTANKPTLTPHQPV
jgi:hypothetical protein